MSSGRKTSDQDLTANTGATTVSDTDPTPDADTESEQSNTPADTAETPEATTEEAAEASTTAKPADTADSGAGGSASADAKDGTGASEEEAASRVADTGAARVDDADESKPDADSPEAVGSAVPDEQSSEATSAGSVSTGKDSADTDSADTDSPASTATRSGDTDEPTDAGTVGAEDSAVADTGSAGTDGPAGTDANSSDTDEPAEAEAGSADADKADADKADADKPNDTDSEDADAVSASKDGSDDESAPADRGTFDSAGNRIAWRAWLPQDAVRGVIVLVHGVAEHAGRYEHVGKRFSDAGYAVYALDHTGHGASAGARANIGSMDSAADNVAQLLEVAGQEFPEVPRFLTGHSMGALVVLYLVTRTPVDVAGVVVSAPPLDIPVGNPAQRLLAPVLTRLAPNLGVLKLDSSDISRDPDVVAAYDNDPLVFRGKLPARTATEILNASIAVKGRLDKLTVPTLAMHGTADTIAAPSSTDLIEKGAGTEDLTVRRYEGLYHEIFNEPEKDQVLGDVVDWLNAHSGTE